MDEPDPAVPEAFSAGAASVAVAAVEEVVGIIV